MNIRYANKNDLDMISCYDKHIDENELLNIINQRRVLVAEENGEFRGWRN